MIKRYEISVCMDFGLYPNYEYEEEKSGHWIRYEDYIAEKESITHDAVLGELLKIIESEYIDNTYKFKSDVKSLHKSFEVDGWNNALNKIKKEILSISA